MRGVGYNYQASAVLTSQTTLAARLPDLPLISADVAPGQASTLAPALALVLVLASPQSWFWLIWPGLTAVRHPGPGCSHQLLLVRRLQDRPPASFSSRQPGFLSSPSDYIVVTLRSPVYNWPGSASAAVPSALLSGSVVFHVRPGIRRMCRYSISVYLPAGPTAERAL